MDDSPLLSPGRRRRRAGATIARLAPRTGIRLTGTGEPCGRACPSRRPRTLAARRPSDSDLALPPCMEKQQSGALTRRLLRAGECTSAARAGDAIELHGGCVAQKARQSGASICDGTTPSIDGQSDASVGQRRMAPVFVTASPTANPVVALAGFVQQPQWNVAVAATFRLEARVRVVEERSGVRSLHSPLG